MLLSSHLVSRQQIKIKNGWILGFLCFMYPFCLNRFKAWVSVFSCIFNIVQSRSLKIGGWFFFFLIKLNEDSNHSVKAHSYRSMWFDVESGATPERPCVSLAGCKDKAANWGGEDADPGGWAHAANHAPGAGDHSSGERAGSQGEEACGGRAVPPGETGRCSAVGLKNPISHPSIISVSPLFCPCVMKKSLNTFY